MEIINKIDKFSRDEPYEELEFQNIDFSLMDIKGAHFLSCHFVHCNFANQSLLNVSLKDVQFRHCNLMGINWCQTKRLEVSYLDSRLNFSVFQNMKLKKIHIENCSVKNADFSFADLTEAKLCHNNFEGTDFVNANLTKADMRESFHYRFDPRQVNLKGTKLSTSDALVLLEMIGVQLDD